MDLDACKICEKDFKEKSLLDRIVVLENKVAILCREYDNKHKKERGEFEQW